MSVSNNGTDIAHNVQIVVDRKEHIVVAVDVVSSPADQGQLFRMAEKAISEMNIDLDSKKENIITVLADKGYYKYEDFEKCKKARIKAIVPKQKAPTVDGNREYSKDNFRFDKEKDQYYCPQNHILKCVSKPTTKTKKYGNAKACKECEYIKKCTRNKTGKVITRSEHQELYDEVNKTMKDNKELYRERQMIVEHPFGTVKRAFGYTYFLTRGNACVKAESFMHFFIYNLKRVINIIGIPRLIGYLMDKTAIIIVKIKIMAVSFKILRNRHKILIKIA